MAVERRLFFIAGATPQIITETVWALAHQDLRERQRVAKTEVVVLTTSIGRQHIENALLAPRSRWQGLQRAWPVTRAFSLRKENVHVLERNGTPLEDVRSEQDGVVAGDTIYQFVRKFTEPHEPTLYASLAGGRKTMSALLALAMTLLARREDRLLHVLIQPPELEGTDFFFPAPQGKYQNVRDARGGVQRIPSKAIRIDLALVPFVRLRPFRRFQEAEEQSFSRLIEVVEKRIDAINRPSLSFVWSGQELKVWAASEVIPLSPLQTAIYCVLARRRRAHGDDQPCSGCPTCFLPSDHQSFHQFASAVRDLARRLESHAVNLNARARGAQVWSMKHFRPEVSKIARALERVLHEAAELYRITTRGGRKAKLYGLSLDPSCIQLQEL